MNVNAEALGYEVPVHADVIVVQRLSLQHDCYSLQVLGSERRAIRIVGPTISEETSRKYCRTLVLLLR